MIRTDPDIWAWRSALGPLGPLPQDSVFPKTSKQPHQSSGDDSRESSFTCEIISASERQKGPVGAAEKTTAVMPQGQRSQLDLLCSELIGGVLK